MITKRDIACESWHINHYYMMKWMNRYISIIFNSRSYTKNIVELNWYCNNQKILERKFTTYREAWNYLIGVQDWLNVL